MGDALLETYKKRVAEVLERTGHPRRRDVLEELEAHLHEIADREEIPACMEDLVDRLGEPEEFAEMLVPAAEHQRKPLTRRRSFWVGLTISAALCGLCAYIVATRHDLAAHLREALDRNYYSTPFFDLAGARSLKSGAAEGEIRDAIGYPIRRYSLLGSEDEVVWEYTAIPCRETPFYTSVRVITDAEDLSLLRTEIRERERIGNPPEQRVVRRAVSFKVGATSYTRHGRDRLTLTPSLDGVVVICHGMPVKSVADLSAGKLRQREAYVAAAWRDVPMDRVRFVHLVGAPVGTMTRAELDEFLDQLPADSPVYSEESGAEFQNRGVPVGSLVYDVYLYSKGVLYQSPPLYGGTDRIMDSYREDQNWLIRRLLEN